MDIVRIPVVFKCQLLDYPKSFHSLITVSVASLPSKVKLDGSGSVMGYFVFTPFCVSIFPFAAKYEDD